MNESNKDKSGTGLAFNGHRYFTFSAKDFSQCFDDRCKEGEPVCQSLNYYSDTKSCDLNNGIINKARNDISKITFLESGENVPFCRGILLR